MSHILEQLYDIIQSRKGSDADSSYVASLYAKGTEKIAQKVGEEAVETIIEAMKNDKAGLKQESADLLFHLMVLWADQDIHPQDIFKILENRMGLSGLEEKKRRTKHDI